VYLAVCKIRKQEYIKFVLLNTPTTDIDEVIAYEISNHMIVWNCLIWFACL